MSLEDKIEQLCKAVEANTAALQKVMATRDEVLKAAKPKATEGDADKMEAAREATKAKPGPKPKAKESEPAAKKTEAKIELKKKVSIDELLKAYGGWFNSTDDKAIRKEMKAFAVAVLEELGAAQLNEVSAEDAPKALYWLELKKAGKKVDFNAELDDDGDEDEDDDDILGGKTKKRVIADDDDEDEDEE